MKPFHCLVTENESDLSKRIKELERAIKQKELELKDKEKELKHEQAHRRAMEILIELAFSLLGARVFSDIDVIVFIG